MDIDSDDTELIEVAQNLIDRVGDGSLHTVGSALLLDDGTIYSAVNVFAQGGGADAELAVIAKAISDGKSRFVTIVAVGDRGRGVIPPCGVCRQLLLDYAPNINVITEFNGQIQKVKITELMPGSYPSWFAKRVSDPS